ncbi:MAG: hypothetical protein JNM90_07310 [Burkholderiales bacterium]|nr:hypothetical protein [Burkholderiales bacterium]
MRRFQGIIVALLAIVLAGAAHAQQRMVAIPDAAKRADMVFDGSPEVSIDGRAARLAPGARVFDRNNFLQMHGGLRGAYKVRYTVEQLSGLIQTVWILTDEEIARPDPVPAK